MSKEKTLTVDLKRVIAGSPAAVYDAWLDPKQPANIFNVCKDVQMERKVGALFYFRGPHTNGAHYGRFLKLAKGKETQMAWMSYYTRGRETVVTARFKKHPGGTLMSIKHVNLPLGADGRGHKEGWEMFLGMMEELFNGRKK
jgi:uncharacterized protein YndB with AHSA1/START domain